jgi:hypothetical protein
MVAMLSHLYKLDWLGCELLSHLKLEKGTEPIHRWMDWTSGLQLSKQIGAKE